MAQHFTEAEVDLFDSKQVKRSADFISQKTETDGTNRLKVPAGAYWGIPRSCRLHFIEVAGDMQAVDLVLG
jgi:hypothetical protein